MLVVLLFIVLYIFCIGTRKPKQDITPFKTHLYAHRGLYNNTLFPCENTLGAFQRAIDHGYGIELDVQYTRDGQIVVFHDKSLKRLCGIDKQVCETDYRDILPYNLPCGSKVPLFKDVLALIDGKVPIIVELKPFKHSFALVKEVVDLLKDYKGVYCIESFNPLPILWLRLYAPHIFRGQLSNGNFTPEYLTSIHESILLKYLFVNVLSAPHFVAYTPNKDHNIAMFLLKKIYKPLMVGYTIQSQIALNEAKNKGYDIIIFEGFLAHF